MQKGPPKLLAILLPWYIVTFVNASDLILLENNIYNLLNYISRHIVVCDAAKKGSALHSKYTY